MAPYVASLEAGTRNLTLGQFANIADALGRGLDLAFPEVQAGVPASARSSRAVIAGMATDDRSSQERAW
jgi:hypothetical protein